MKRNLLTITVCLTCAAVAQTPTATRLSGNGAVILDGGRFVFPGPFDGEVRLHVTGHPYSDVEEITTSGRRPDGTMSAHTRVERRFRDQDGRERFESGDMHNGVFRIGDVRLNDPVSRTNVNMGIRDNTWNILLLNHYPPTPQQDPVNQRQTEKIQAQAVITRANRPDRPLVETLPDTAIAGVAAIGKRTTYIIPAGKEGNAEAVPLVAEIWISPELHIMLAQTLDDPRQSKTVMRVISLKLGDPDPKYFQVPENGQAVDPALER